MREVVSAHARIYRILFKTPEFGGSVSCKNLRKIHLESLIPVGTKQADIHGDYMHHRQRARGVGVRG